MRLFLYYAAHTFKNQLKKLFKTWVLIFFAACLVLGVLVGVGVAMLEEASEPDTPPGSVEIVEPGGEDEPDEPDEPGISLPVSAAGVIELAAGGVVLLFLVMSVLGADKSGSKIFLPADVTLLFASPMKPCSVLLFRLMTQLGTVLVSTFYLAFQIPNLMLNLGLGWADVTAILLTWCLTVGFGKLFETFLYIFIATDPSRKPYLRRILYLVLLAAAGGFILFARLSGGDYLTAADGFFNHPVSRYIPVWGWLKGICMYTVEGNPAGALLCLAAVLLSGGGLIFLTGRMKADFYEDAMQKSEETAALQEAARSEQSVGFVKRKKDRSEKIRRDGLTHGAGASVFFHRIMYNRFRFAHFRFFTKTMETYLVAALGMAAVCRFGLQIDSCYPVVFVLGGLAFFRAFGNNLEEDTSKHFFLLIPASTRAKLFYSLLGGTVGCLIDLLPAMLAGGLLLGCGPLPLLLWLPVIVTVDFFATNVGAFINLSVPVSAGKTVKQLVMILFLYFGLLPDVAVLAVGFLMDAVPAAAVIASAMNLGVGFLFLALTPLFLEPKDKPVREKPVRSPEERKAARRAFSRMGLSAAAVLLFATLLQLGLMFLRPDWLATKPGFWLITFAPIYLVAFPVGLLFLRGLPREAPKAGRLGGKGMTAAGFISIFLMYAGNLTGLLVSSLLSGITGRAPQAGIIQYAMQDDLFCKLLFLVVLAPLVEEYFFRKQLIDRMARYGGGLAVVVSAGMFGLFHGNLNQLFYAFALGLVFGYVYLKTGKLRYSVGLHMGVNLLGSVVAPALLEQAGAALAQLETAGPEELFLLVSPALLLFFGYCLLMVIAAIVGLVLLCVNARRIRFSTAPLALGKGRFSVVVCNPGMLLLLAGCLGLIVLSLL